MSQMRPLKQITLKVFTPENRSHKTFIVKCPNGTQLKRGGENVVLKRFADELEKNFPLDDFEMREVGRGCFNFVWVRRKPVEEQSLAVAGMELGKQTTVEMGAC